ncbi:hypothetical protein TDB9533_01715 [Thalassocella blandensis]|nr:hypothetical protein TDB9533_01715 [Thalassocella blandensis]
MFNRFAQYLLKLEKSHRISDLQIAGFIVGLMVVSVSSTLIIVSLMKKEVVSEIPLTFGIYDAEQICVKQMDQRLGDSFLRYHLDTHSSRLDQKAGIFRLFLKADIGNLSEYDEVSVHCFISLSGKNLEHYRVHGLSHNTQWETKIKFF